MGRVVVSFPAALAVVVCAAFLAASVNGDKLEPDVYLDCPGLIRSRGYTAEEHRVVTRDGFILRVFRIPRGRHASPTSPPGPPVLMMHALLCSSDEYVMEASADASLGLVLADAGFDVWITNKRGNTYGTNHTSLKPDDKRFWDWTWDEVGLEDIPAAIEHITDVTGAKTVGYVGHSEGTVAGFVAASASRARNKINSLALLAPIANMTVLGNHGLMQWLVKLGESAMYTTMGRKEFLSQTPFLKKWGPEFCSVCPSCCRDILFMFCGIGGDTSNYNTSRFPVYYAHTPSGTSIENMGHWIQLIENKKWFRMYDYHDSAKNIAKYGTAVPPEYDIGTIVQPIALFAGKKDPLASPANIEAITSQLRPGIWTLHMEEAYAHMDFAWGLNAKDRIFPGVIKLLQKGVQWAASQN